MVLYRAGLGVIGETRALVSEQTVPAGLRTDLQVTGYLPSIGDFPWLNWLGAGYDSAVLAGTKLTVEDASGATAQEVSAEGSKTTIWISLKPYWKEFMLKGEIRFELSRTVETKVSLPPEQALVATSLTELSFLDEKPRLHLGLEARVSSAGILQLSGVVPLEQQIDVKRLRANGNSESVPTTLTEYSFFLRFNYLLTFYERPHQIALVGTAGVTYDQRAYRFSSSSDGSVTMPADVAPFLLLGLSYS